MGNSNRLQILHGRPEDTGLNVLIAFEFDFTDFNLGPFFDYEGDANCGWRNLPDLRPNRGKLPAMLGQQLFDRHFRLLDTRGIVLALYDQADLVLLEAVENVAVGNRASAHIINRSYRGLLFHLHDNSPALRGLLAQKFDVLEIPRVPKRVEIPLQRRGVVHIPRFSED